MGGRSIGRLDVVVVMPRRSVVAGASLYSVVGPVCASGGPLRPAHKARGRVSVAVVRSTSSETRTRLP